MLVLLPSVVDLWLLLSTSIVTVKRGAYVLLFFVLWKGQYVGQPIVRASLPSEGRPKFVTILIITIKQH